MIKRSTPSSDAGQDELPKVRAFSLMKVFIIIFLFPFVAFLTVLGLAISCPKVLINSGDKLYDYVVVKTFNDSLGFLRRSGLDKAVFDRTNIELFEDPTDISSDPRYVMYRAKDNFNNVLDGANSSFSVPLAEIYASGEYDIAILANHFRMENEIWKEAVKGERLAPKPGQSQSRREYTQLRRVLIDEEYGSESLELEELLLSIGSDQAFAYYELATIEAERENYAKAMDLIRKGNATPLNSTLTGYPTSELVPMARAATISDDPLIRGCIGQEIIGSPIKRYIDSKTSFQSLVDVALQNEDLEALDDLHTFAVRYTSSSDAVMLDILVGLVLIGYMQIELVNQCPHLIDTEEQKRIDELEKLRKDLLNETKRINKLSPYYQLYSLNLSNYKNIIKRYAAAGFSSELMVLEWSNYEINHLRELELNAVPLIKKIDSFNYTSLDWDVVEQN